MSGAVAGPEPEEPRERPGADRSPGRRGVGAGQAAVVFAAAGAVLASVSGLLVLASESFSLRQTLGAGYGLLVAALVAAAGLSLAAYLSRLAGVAARRRAPAGRPLRLLFYSAVAGAAAYLAFWQPYERSTFLLALALTAGGFGLLLLLEGRLGGRLWRGADVVLFNLCLALVGAEAALRVYASLRPSILFLQPDADAATIVERARPRPRARHFGLRYNSGGYYDTEFRPKPPGRRLVVAIGDSFSLGVVPLPFHFTSVAERLLPATDVYNMGLPGLGPREYLHLLQTEALALDPDVVVINLFVGNDLTESALPFAAPDRLRRWFDRDNVLVVQVPQRLSALAREPGLAAPAGAAEDRTAAAAGRQAPSRRQLEKRFPWLRDPLLETPAIEAGRFLRIEQQRFEGLRDLGVKELDRRLAVLERMRRLARGTPLVVMVIPDEFQVEPALWERVAAASGAATEERDRVHRLLVAWLDSRRFPYLDLLPRLRAVELLADGRLHVYHRQDTHFNARGNRVAGEALAGFLYPYLGLE